MVEHRNQITCEHNISEKNISWRQTSVEQYWSTIYYRVAHFRSLYAGQHMHTTTALRCVDGFATHRTRPIRITRDTERLR